MGYHQPSAQACGAHAPDAQAAPLRSFSAHPAPAFPAQDWIERFATMTARRGSTIKADVSATRRRILDMSSGRCTFDVMRQ